MTDFVRDTFHVENTLPTSIDALTYFISYMHRDGMAASTICTYTYVIGYVNRLAGHPNPNQTFLIKKLLASVTQSTHQPDSRLPVTPAILNKLVELLTFAAPVCYNRIMLKVMCLLAFHAFLRVGEMTRNTSDTNILHCCCAMCNSSRRVKHTLLGYI